MPDQATTPAPASDPKEIARVYADVAQRSARLLRDHIQRQMAKGLKPPSDELGIARAYMEWMAQAMAQPQQLVQAQMGLMRDYMALWQQSMQGAMGLKSAPVVAAKKGDNRFKDPEWENNSLFDFVKQSDLITARHVRIGFSNGG